MILFGNALLLIDEFISSLEEWGWEANQEYYLEELLPGLKTMHSAKNLEKEELDIISKIKELVYDNEWNSIDEIIINRRSKKLSSLQSDLDRKAAEDIFTAKKNQFFVKLKELLQNDYLNSDIFFKTNNINYFSQDEYDNLKSEFVTKWAEEHLDIILDKQQAMAVADLSRNLQVTARAGSGKTRVLTVKSIFLQKHCNIPHTSILILAFNKKAVNELSTRLKEILGNNIPYVMTFHALAHAIVHPFETILFDDFSADQLPASREIQNIINRYINDEYYKIIIEKLMFKYFRTDYNALFRNFFSSNEELSLVNRRSLISESLKGDYIKSYGEKLIANILFEHDIDYDYEKPIAWDNSAYRPDFTISKKINKTIIIEYFGVTGEHEYDTMTEEKIEFWQKKVDFILIKVLPKDIAVGEENFTKNILSSLEKYGIVARKLSDAQIWSKIRARAIRNFTKTMRTFIAKCRKYNLSTNELESRINLHEPLDETEDLFLTIAVRIYDDYLKNLIDKHQTDFDGLVWNAEKQIQHGNTLFSRNKGKDTGDIKNLKYVMIDEFQDFSMMFYSLIKSFRKINASINYFCVGDNWQAINTFAGSSLTFFTDFMLYFPNAHILHLSTNYRSTKAIVFAGNSLMSDEESPSIPSSQDYGRIISCTLDQCDFTPTENAIHKTDFFTPALLRFIRYLLQDNERITLLSRRSKINRKIITSDGTEKHNSSLESFLIYIKEFLPQDLHERVFISTTHKYKGLESDAILIIDPLESAYPLVHPTWFFNRLFGDTLDEIILEEMRLFYVAISRAINTLAFFILYEDSISPFFRTIQNNNFVEELCLSNLPQPSYFDSRKLQIKIFNAFKIKDQLKLQNYSFVKNGKYWTKFVDKNTFDRNNLLTSPWFTSAIAVEICEISGEIIDRIHD
jgi:DNA helicase-4